MNKRGFAAIKADIELLSEGKIDVPLPENSARGAAKSVCGDLEKLRMGLLNQRISYEEKISHIDSTIAGVAHDLKTPIATIAGYAECLQDGIDDKDYAALISEKAARMNEQVLEMVESLRADKKESVKTRVEITSLILATVKELQPLATSKKIALKYLKSPKAYVYVNATEIERVIQNFITNAIKYSEENTTVKVVGRIWGNSYFIRVIDRGMGISKEDLKRVFEKFYMVDKARKNGSGLGLYVVKEIVEAHGGEVFVHSKPGKGSNFAFSLPVVSKKIATPTEKFEKMSRLSKCVVTFYLGFLFGAVFRIIKYAETRSPSTLICGFLALPFFMFFWAADFLSELVYNRISFLCD